MSKAEDGNDLEATTSLSWDCHFCGVSFADKDQAAKAHQLLVRHIKVECQNVPEPIRERYGSACPNGSCDG